MNSLSGGYQRLFAIGACLLSALGGIASAQQSGTFSRPAGYTLNRNLPVVELGPLPSNSRIGKARPGVKQLGQVRSVPERALDKGVTLLLPNGVRVWRIIIRSEGATALRVHFREFSVGDGQVWVYARSSTDIGHTTRMAGPFSNGHHGKFYPK